MRVTYAKALLCGALLAAPAALVLVATSFWPNGSLMQPNGFYLGTDFVNYWAGGRLALLGRTDVIYDVARYHEQLRAWFSPDLRLMNFSYPPHALLLLGLVGSLPYFAALLGWSVAGVVAFGAAALGRWPDRRETPLLLAFALAPVIWTNLVFGQFGLLLAALFVGALRALPTRPVLAGILIGVLTIKPQLGLLLPVLLLLTGAWRAMAAAVVSTLVLVGLSVAAFGLDPWRTYVAETMPFQWDFITIMNGFYRFQMVTPYTLLWFLGVPVKSALAAQTVVSLVIAALTGLAVRSHASWPLKAAIVAFGSMLMVPYMLVYDLAIPCAALVWYLGNAQGRATNANAAMAGAMWALPFGLGIFLQMAGLPATPIVTLACFLWLVQEALGLRLQSLQRTAAAPSKT